MRVKAPSLSRLRKLAAMESLSCEPTRHMISRCDPGGRSIVERKRLSDQGLEASFEVSSWAIASFCLLLMLRPVIRELPVYFLKGAIASSLLRGRRRKILCLNVVVVVGAAW
jgi:hypothetical protein